MTGPPVSATEEQVADYVRSTMRVDPPQGLIDDVMRSVAAVPQERRTLFSAFGPVVPAIGAVAATALILVGGLFLFAPRNVGPAPDPTPTPAPTLTPEDARDLSEPGDVIRIPALDSEGQFGTIVIERGEEKAGYDGFIPFAFEDVFFVELYVTYEPERPTDEEYGEWEFAFAVDLDGDGFGEGDELRRGVGFLGMEDQPGFESAPEPMLHGMRGGDEVLEGWLVLELPAAAAEFDLYLVYGHAEWTDGIGNMAADTSALLRLAGEPAGVTAFDPDQLGPDDGSTPGPMPSLQSLPSPMPTPAATFEPQPDTHADGLFEETQECVNVESGVRVTFPAAWHTNQDAEGWADCALFGPDPIDSDRLSTGFDELPPIRLLHVPASWSGGIEEPRFERLPVDDRIVWRLTYREDQGSSGTHYLVPLSDDQYGPFAWIIGLPDEARGVLDRILMRLESVE